MKRLLWIMVLLLAMPVVAEEVAVPSTPVPVTEDVVTKFIVERLTLQCGGPRLRPMIVVGVLALRADGQCAHLSGGGGCREVTKTYYNTEAHALCETLNTANLSTNSLHKRVLNKLITDGVLPPAAVEGTPGIPTPLPTATPEPVPTAPQ